MIMCFSCSSFILTNYNRINRKVSIMAKEAGVDGDLVLKRETERITSIVIKDASIKGYKIYKTKDAIKDKFS